MIILISQFWDRLLTAESDVYRRQILTSKVDPRAVRVNPFSAYHDYGRFESVFLADQITIIRDKISA